MEAELFVGRANQNHPAQVTSDGAEERHHLDPARVSSVSLGTEETHHRAEPAQAPTVPLTEGTEHIGPTQDTAVSTGTEDTHHIDPVEIAIVSPSIEEDFRLDPVQVMEHFDRIGRFRILVIGRSNAGKTTLLQRVCNTTELPEIFNVQGERVKYLLTRNPSNC